MAQCVESKSANVIRAKPFKWYFEFARHCSKHVIKVAILQRRKLRHILSKVTQLISERTRCKFRQSWLQAHSILPFRTEMFTHNAGKQS